MSLATSSRVTTTAIDDLVPSRYDLRIGDVDVLAISDGVLPLPAATLATNADPAELAAWLEASVSDEKSVPLTRVYTTPDGRAVIEQPQGSVVLFDAEQILLVIEELNACYDYCAAWKDRSKATP